MIRIEDLSPEQYKILQEYAVQKKEQELYRRTNKLLYMYPDEGACRRELYPKHIQFFNAIARQRLFTAGNRCGKTISGSYETSLHLTGLYPDWWMGRRFGGATQVCCAGDTNESTRDIIQKELFGDVEGVRGGKRWVAGTGMIPLENVVDIFWKSGVQNMIDYAIIRHADGGMSKLVLKTYAQGRKLFQGTAYHVIWFDEEPPEDVYGEALTRTATTGGIAYLTFTPLQGVSKTIQLFLPEGHVHEYNDGVRAVINMTWEDAPHLDQQTREELILSYPPHMRDARTKGLPSLGSGAVYPISEENILVDDFPIPIFWKRAFAMDVGWNWNAAVFGAWDDDAKIMYIYSEIKLSHVEPETFSQAIKARAGDWMNGVIDPASQGSNQFDGRKLMDEYRKLGLKISPADNAVEAGTFQVYTAMLEGRFKVFRSCTDGIKEFRLYQRDDKGRIKKENDHIVDAWRYLERSGALVATINPEAYRGKDGRIHAPQNIITEFNLLD